MSILKARLTATMMSLALLGLVTAGGLADYIDMIDVDKPTVGAPTYNTWGDFTNIDPAWSATCWQAVSASMLNYVAYGATADIYAWFHDAAHYGNNGATNVEWRNAINDFIANSGFVSPSGPYEARLKVDPTDDWAEAMIANSPIGLGVVCGGDYSGEHAIAYSGFEHALDQSWIADPDSDLRSKTLPEPPSYMDWSLLDDKPSTAHNWMLERTWTDGRHLTFDVDGGIYFVPEPATIVVLLVSVLVVRRR